jgi:hypothetical protein
LILAVDIMGTAITVTVITDTVVGNELLVTVGGTESSPLAKAGGLFCFI